MSQATDQSTVVNASVVWEQLSGHIDAFVAAWQNADAPPAIGQFVPSGPPALRRLTLVETIKVDLEYRWQARRWPKIVEEYVREFPELAEGGLPCDVIYEEYHIRKQHGDAVTVDEYCDRFPTRVDELRRLMQIEAPTQTTVLVPRQRMPVFEAGQQVDDFDLLSPLGKGAFATVFRARQRSMQRVVALKISRDRSLEPQTLAQLEHPNIVRVFDQRALDEHKLRLLYMQYVPGGTLQGVVEHAKTMPPGDRAGGDLLAAVDKALVRNGEEPPADSLMRYRLQGASWAEIVCWMGARLATALAHAHQHGILHRDIKPANVLLGADCQPKLADFNISFSKLDGATPAAYFGGTLAYMSPEQLEAYDPAHERLPDSLDARSDIYSLGVVLWEMLTLRRPFVDVALSEDWSQALPRMTSVRWAGLSPEARASVPAPCPPIVVEVLEKCMAPSPADRYATGGELARELELCLQPRAHAMLHTRRTRGSILKRHPVTSTVLLGLVPNLVMGVLIIAYTWNEIVNRLSPADQSVFQVQLGAINLAGYALGLGYICTTRGRLFMTLARLAGGQQVATPSLDLVRRSLTLGAATAGVTAVLWSISGFVFPTWIHFGAGSMSRLSGEDYAHFVLANMLCGMIAATQSYYVVTFLSVRNCYPWLMRARSVEAREIRELSGVARMGRIVLGVTVSTPFIALAALLWTDSGRAVIGALAAIGFLGCALAYLLDLAIRADLGALATAINPSGDSLGGGDSLDSLLTGSRR
jgi:eukaryotic-like serine/threonine-protein kinase